MLRPGRQYSIMILATYSKIIGAIFKYHVHHLLAAHTQAYYLSGSISLSEKMGTITECIICN